MKKKKYKEISCPTCGKKNTWTDENTVRPFCSERCKLIDLGEWADEKYRFTGEKINPEEIDENDKDETDNK